MKLSTLWVSWASLLVGSPTTAKPPIVAQYWPAYASSSQPPSAFPWNQTDLAYYFVTTTTESGFKPGGAQSLADLKSFVAQAKAHNTKALFSIGGWEGSVYFSDLLATTVKRQKFAKQVQAFMTQYGFDGVDIDWEYPYSTGIGCNTDRPKDYKNLLNLLKILRTSLGSSKLITAAVSATGIVGADGNVMGDMSPYAQYVDYLNLMTVSFVFSRLPSCSPWSATTGPLSPLRTCNTDGSVTDAVMTWTSASFPAEKLLIGIPSYAISFTTNSSTLSTTTVNGGSSKLFQAWTGVVPKGDSSDITPSTNVCNYTTTAHSGHWQYWELIDEGFLSKNGTAGRGGYTRYFDQCTQTPFLFNPKKRHFLSYDDPQSAGAKAVRVALPGLIRCGVAKLTANSQRQAWARKRGVGGVQVAASVPPSSDLQKTDPPAPHAA
ncbi:SPOSA6832_03687, partial [Sporobolomyces salmonicolor]